MFDDKVPSVRGPADAGRVGSGGAGQVEDLDTSSMADAIADLGREGRLLGARRLLLAVSWADRHVPACQQQQQRRRDADGDRAAHEPVCGCQGGASTSPSAPWRRRLWICRRPGSDGTPAVSASGVAEYAVHCGTTTQSGSVALGEALDLRHRHPRLWRRLMAGEVEEWQARRVARTAAWLTREQADEVDRATAHVLAKLPWGRCSDVVEAAVIAADPEGHDERRREHDERCYVSAGRYRGADAKGNRTLVARTSAGNVARLDALVQHLAELLGAAGDGDAVQVRRAKAIGLLANPAQVCVLLGQTVTPDRVDSAEPAPAPTGDTPAVRSTHEQDDETDAGPTSALCPDPSRAPGPDGGPDPDADLDADRELDPELDPEPVPVPGPPTAVELAAAFGRELAALAERQGHRSAWDLLRPRTTLFFHLGEDGVVARMADSDGPLGPVGPRQLRDLLSEQLPAWLVDHLDGRHPPGARLGDQGHDAYADADATSAAQGGREARGRGHTRPRFRDQIVVRPVLDVAGQEPVDGYEVPAPMHEAVVQSSVFEIFPWGTADARRCQIDHTVPYVHDRSGPRAAGRSEELDETVASDAVSLRGQTRPDNLGPLSVGHHNLKTHAGWRCHQPLPGLYLWQTPSGHWFRVDHTGTTPLGRDRPAILRQREERVGGRLSSASGTRSPLETRIGRLLVDVA